MKIRRLPLILVLCGLLTPPLAAITIHRSFRPTAVGTGGPTAVVAPGYVPRQPIGFTPPAPPERNPKERKTVGKVVAVDDAGTIWILANGGSRQKIRLDRLIAPKDGEPFAAEARKFLSDLVLKKKVEVRYTRKTSAGTPVGVVFLEHAKGLVDVNLTLIRNGAARHDGETDQTEAYQRSETAAKEARLGLWHQ